MKKLLALMMSILMITCIFASCGENKDDGGEATLYWAMPFYEQSDLPKVSEQVNKLLAEKLPNTKIQFMLDSSMGDKWPLWMAGDKQVDIAHVGMYVDLLSEVEKDSFYPLNDLVDKYAPTIKKEIETYKDHYATGTVDGELYGIPNIQIYINDTATLIIPSNLRSCLDVDAFVKEAYANPTTTEKMYQMLDDYLKKAMATDKTDTDTHAPVISIKSLFSTFARRGFAFVGSGGQASAPTNICYKVFDDEVKIIDFYDTDEFKMFMKWARKWYLDGYIGKDVLSGDEGYGNRQPILSSYVWDMSLREDDQTYLRDESTLWISMQNEEHKFLSHTSVGSLATYNSIPYTSKNPERAMKLLELLHTEEGSELLNMICYGIEGEHYNKISDTEIKAVDYLVQGTSASKYGIPNWMVGTHFNMYVIAPYDEGTRTRAQNYYENLYPNYHKTKIYGINFKTNSISNYYSQLETVLDEYQLQLYSGASPDYEKIYKEACTKMDSAGVDKIIVELQNQVDAFIKK